MGTLVLTLLALAIGFPVMTGAGYAVHWLLHQKWSGMLYAKHMVHHLVLYPVSDFLSESYRRAGRDNTVVTFLFFSIPFFVAPVILYALQVVPAVTAALLLVEIIVVGWLHDYFHDSFHIRGHFLKRYAFFRRLTDLHYLHHKDMSKNFGIFLFWWDRIFASFLRKV